MSSNNFKLGKISLIVEKFRIPLLLFGVLMTIILQLTQLYRLAADIIYYEFGEFLSDYAPEIPVAGIIKTGMILILFPLILNTSALKQDLNKIITAGIWGFLFLLKLVGLAVGSYGLDVLIVILFITFFILTFKAKKGMNVMMILIKLLQLLDIIFIFIYFNTEVYNLLEFRIFRYITIGVSLIVDFWFMVYFLTLLKRSPAIKENISLWKAQKDQQIQGYQQQAPIQTQYNKQQPINQQHQIHQNREVQTSSLSSGDMIFPIPRAQFWCPKCNTSVKLSLRGGKEDIYSQHNCPICGTTLLGWWARGPKLKYYQFLAGLALMAGGMFSMMIENIVLQEGLIPVIVMNVLGLIFFISGVILLFIAANIKVTQPPSDAAKVLPSGVYENFGKQIVIVTIVGTIGGLVLFGVARIVTLIAII